MKHLFWLIVLPLYCVGSMISGECSACHEVLLVKGSGTQTPGDLSYMIKQAFLEHPQRKHHPDSHNN